MKLHSTPSDRVPFAARVRMNVASKFELVAEAFGLAFAASGATVSVLLGKFIIGIVLAALAVGFLLRLKGRKARSARAELVRPTTFARFVAALVSACEVAVLVEATNLPIRFDQAAFHMGHWYLVLLAFFASYFLQLPLIARLFGKRGTRGAT
ncbi:hypothetical protein [Paucibacter sp. Y2R2-4]|uniref:hypothetical protein n=1 Tax=Paucibacter sp. Y2R2-4 TaxID=2893553 RepID=UPI0021E369FA|nr:hypothetical protein [Paucibacter sp. Y2R2-4]MCV2350818.1 hypothetical protein [Paucibacter sp. Y2R2-4]